MVDSTKITGSVSGVTAPNKVQSFDSKRNKETQEASASAETDEVDISDEAQEIAAKKSAEAARRYLNEHREVTLGLDASFFDEAV